MNFLETFELFGNVDRAQNFLDTVKSRNFLFSFVISYTETCEIPGITFAGEDKNSIQYTPPADAEYTPLVTRVIEGPSSGAHPRPARWSRNPPLNRMHDSGKLT